jgi:acetoin utilization deacetylase AcuC-like enzyme
VLIGVDEVFEEHDAGPGHPERPQRVGAVLAGMQTSDVAEDLVYFSPRPADPADLLRVHTPEHVDRVFSTSGVGGMFDPDTSAGPRSARAALVAAGAGMDAVGRLRSGAASAAFLVTRPPGHHARPDRAMGFCLFNSIAVTAASLVAEGERVLIIDWDAHHGNGTQEIFYEDPSVLFVSFHQYPFYPGSGAASELGAGAGLGTTVNLPLPSGAGGDAYRYGFDEVVLPAVEAFSPTWLLVSCGFDAHRDDPLTDLGLVANDFADLTSRVAGLGAPGRRIFFLEGGYDLEALRLSAGAVVSVLGGGNFRPERALWAGRDDRSASGPVGGVVRELQERIAALPTS